MFSDYESILYFKNTIELISRVSQHDQKRLRLRLRLRIRLGFQICCLSFCWKTYFRLGAIERLVSIKLMAYIVYNVYKALNDKRSLTF